MKPSKRPESMPEHKTVLVRSLRVALISFVAWWGIAETSAFAAEVASASSKPATSKSRSSKRSTAKRSASKKRSSNAVAKSAACGMRTPIYEHVVEPGDSIAKIASEYGVVSAAVVALNSQLANPNLLRPGQTVKICPEIAPRERVVSQHAVRTGETLTKIAQRNGLTLRELVSMQPRGFDPRANLRIGQKLVIVQPGAIVAGFADEEERDSQEELKSAHASVRERLPDSPHYQVKREEMRYATAHTVRLVTRVASSFYRKSGKYRLLFGDLSRLGGGSAKGHRSHRTGVDIDIEIPTRGHKDPRDFITASRQTLDVRRTWLLIEEFIRTNAVRYIFIDYSLQKPLYEYARKQGVSEDELEALFQYPRGKSRRRGLIRHWPKHSDHMHIRLQSSGG